MIYAKVNGDRLKKPIDLSLPENDLEKEDYVVDVVLKYLNAAKSPVILVDACAIVIVHWMRCVTWWRPLDYPPL